ncbi:MAG: CehA/McbA family metallohydrolase [Verrucomicrobiales bacterium]|nr:CehA/McbA family metallohydrolase [Verrucomicrobiales bacterium]
MKPRMRNLALLPAVALIAVGPGRADGRLRLSITEGATSRSAPCSVFLTSPDGRPVRPPGLPFWNDHFATDGRSEFPLPAGLYRYELDRGPEFHVARGERVVRDGETATLSARLERIADLPAEGWWSGETHVHRDRAEIPLLMRTADLHLAEVVTWWNETNPWTDANMPATPVLHFDEHRFADVLAGEDERNGGALLFFGRRTPLAITGSQREYPPSMRFLRAAKQDPATWVDVEKPFWLDFPIWLASGLVDSVGICQNHMQRGGMLDNEAWGRARDTAKYPGPHGNGFWTQDIYYHALNCGFRLPPTAGSASGVLPNPVGYNRLYAHVEGELTYPKWWEAVRAGRAFVSNGPLLRCRAGGQLPGHVFKSDQPIRIVIDGQLDSRDPVAAVELVRNGRVEAISLPTAITVQESGWFLVRARADVAHTFRFASTAPWYVEIGNDPRHVQRESAQFFLDWVRERRAGLQLDDASQRAEVVEEIARAEEFWKRKVAQASPKVRVTGRIIDDLTRELLPARIYIQGADRRWHFPESASPEGSAIRYEKQNWINANSVEFHTTLSAHPFRIALSPGRYTVTVERGKEYVPLVKDIEVGGDALNLELPLHRWINMAERGWFSGDTHVHRTLQELPNVMLAEDVNVTFPLVYWVTQGMTPPSAGDKNLSGEIPSAPVEIDPTHVIWPRNTEWEIFTVGGKPHTLGAVFALGHTNVFTQGAPPVKPIAEAAHRQGALLDLDKHDWPWSMALPPIMDVDLYELANNHLWRTEFAFTNWSTPAPAYMNLPNDGRNGTETDWIHYTFQNYYALLNCMFPLRPSAGTANGVHPVPLGFGRVYVHLPEGFRYDAWFAGLDAGRSFVTTGPMLFVEANGQPSGSRFESPQDTPLNIRLTGRVVSQAPIGSIEIIARGGVLQRLTPESRGTSTGAHEADFDVMIEAKKTGWLAVRCWEPRDGGRLRFAHTGPFWLEVGGPWIPEQDLLYLSERIRGELMRSDRIVSYAATEEYREAGRFLAFINRYSGDVQERLSGFSVTKPVPAGNGRLPVESAGRYWLENMVVHHGFTTEEVAAATSMSADEVEEAVARFGLAGRRPEPVRSGAPLRILPYPGGRHPRIGFLDGAINPQRGTKFSVFTPWDPASYVVVDLPEAIWSNLGLTYLAHTHIDTIWDQPGYNLPQIDWTRHDDGTLTHERTLPNGIAFGARVVPLERRVDMELWLRNGTDEKLTNLRAQNCVMLKGAAGFAQQTGDNKISRPPFVARRSEDGRRWLITAWDPLDRVWENPPVPCIHSDPKFADCAPGETVRARGCLWFYEGEDIEAELARPRAQGRDKI